MGAGLTPFPRPSGNPPTVATNGSGEEPTASADLSIVLLPTGSGDTGGSLLTRLLPWQVALHLRVRVPAKNATGMMRMVGSLAGTTIWIVGWLVTLAVILAAEIPAGVPAEWVIGSLVADLAGLAVIAAIIHSRRKDAQD